MGQGESVAPGESSHWCVDQHVLPVEGGVRGTQDRPGEAVTGDGVGEYPFEACGG